MLLEQVRHQMPCLERGIDRLRIKQAGALANAEDRAVVPVPALRHSLLDRIQKAFAADFIHDVREHFESQLGGKVALLFPDRKKLSHYLESDGRHVETLLSPGEPEAEILNLLGQRPRSLLAMGAYGHSRIREFIVGSTTTTLLRLSPVPVMVLR